MARLSAKAVAKEIKDKFNYDVELIKGEGYFYFIEVDGSNKMDTWGSTCVYVCRLGQLSLTDWVEEFEGMIESNTVQIRLFA